MHGQNHIKFVSETCRRSPLPAAADGIRSWVSRLPLDGSSCLHSYK